MALSPFDPRWDPFTEMTSLRDAMSRLMESAFISPGLTGGSDERLGVPVDLSENEDEYVIQASLPGIKPEDVKISVQNNVLTIEGERNDERQRKESERSLYREHHYGKFSRSFGLNSPIDAEHAQAQFEHGVLRLTIPKSEAAKPKQIPITAGASQKVIEGQQVERQQVKGPKQAKA
jgi:HSP20 family protein